MFFTNIPPEVLEQLIKQNEETPKQAAPQLDEDGFPLPGQSGPRLDPRTVIIDGANLVKVVEDNPDLPVGDVRRGYFGG